MRAIQPRHRRSPASFWALSLVVLLLAAGGVAGTLWLLGVNLNPFGPYDDPFMVRLPINSQPIPAYERVERAHMLNPATGGLMFQRIPPQSTVGMSIVGVDSDGSPAQGKVTAVRNVEGNVVFVVEGGKEVPHEQTAELGNVIMDVSAIIGRVVKKDKRAGMAFREETFFPQGTPAGLGGATPPGMQTITLDATKLIGVHALNAGDHIDLIASVPTGELTSFQSPYNSRLPGAALVVPPSGDKAKSAGATEPVLLAKDAIVLKPVYVRNEATTASSLTQGKRVQNVPKYEVAIAVAAADVIPLQGALDRKLEITCVAQSLQPTAEAPAVAAGNGPVAPVTVRHILAYDVVVRDAFVNPATRRLRLEPISQQEIDRLGIVTSVEEALGAVARRDIPAGSYLRRSDLLTQAPQPAPAAAIHETDVQFTALQGTMQRAQPAPGGAVVGDRPAISTFIPAGHTAISLPWNRLYGAEYLEIGDRIDLLASYSLESETEEEETETRPDGTKIVRKRNDIATRRSLRTWDESLGFRGEPWFVATEAIVIGPVGFPPPAPAQRALGAELQRPATSTAQGAAAFSGPPIIVAVDDRDVEHLAAALASKGVLFTPTFHADDDRQALPAGMKRVALAAQDIEAWQPFEETVWQGNRRRPVWRLVRADDARFDQALEAEQIPAYYNRVLNRAKRRGDFFTADDFLPAGVGPGVAAAIGPGTTVFAASDQEIEGLDNFQNEDRVVILIRGVVKAPSGVIAHGMNFERPISSVIVPEARIVRASRGKQSLLEIKNEDLTRLQAAWASSLARDDEQGASEKRSHLLAVALPRGAGGELVASRLAIFQQAAPAPGSEIADYDPLGGIKLMETLVGKERELHAFPGNAEGDQLPATPLDFVGK
jgi:hypothetical protein